MPEPTTKTPISVPHPRAGLEERNDNASLSVAIVGGKRIFRESLSHLLGSRDFHIQRSLEDVQSLRSYLQRCDEGPDVVLLVLNEGAFGTFHAIHDVLQNAPHEICLVVLCEQASRGQVYAALRIGAKAYVNLDTSCEELSRALRMAGQNQVYLDATAAQLLVNDISATAEASGSPKLPSVDLSQREVDIVQLLCEGLSSKEIARRLHISAKTVENHRYNIYRKVEVDSIAGLMRHAIQHGLVTI
jgi:DNA-binding NarL/FixJ family response regulator